MERLIRSMGLWDIRSTMKDYRANNISFDSLIYAIVKNKNCFA